MNEKRVHWIGGPIRVAHMLTCLQVAGMDEEQWLLGQILENEKYKFTLEEHLPMTTNIVNELFPKTYLIIGTMIAVKSNVFLKKERVF